MNPKKLSIAAALLALTLAGQRPANAGTATGSLTVSTTVLNVCTVTSAIASFGNYTGNNSTSASFVVTCNPGSSPSSVTLGSSGTPFAMTSGSSSIPYNVTQGATTIQPGGAITATSGTTYTVNLQTTDAGSMPIGIYSQIVPVTVTF